MKLKIFAVIHMICVWVFHPNPKWFMTRSMHLHNHVINYIHDDVILTWLFHWKQGVMMSLIRRIVLVIGWICVSNITYGISFTQLNTLLPIRGRRNTSPAPYDVIIWWRHHVTTNRFQRRYNRVDHRSINFSPQFFEAPRHWGEVRIVEGPNFLSTTCGPHICIIQEDAMPTATFHV